MKIIQCQRCDADVLNSANRKYCKPCAKIRSMESSHASRRRTKAHNAALRAMHDITPRSRAMAGEGGE